MLESTNALIGALIAVMRELDRCEKKLAGGSLTEDEEEALGPFIDQLHEALADLSAVYEERRKEHGHLLDLEALKACAIAAA